MVISILGVRGSGKDYLAKELKDKYELQGKKVAILGFSDGVRHRTFKELGVEYLGIEWYDKFKTDIHLFQGKYETGRYWLEHFGERLRARYPLIWSNYSIENANKQFDMGADIVIFSDCRFPHEAMSSKLIAYRNAVDVEFYFCDYKSNRYDDSKCDTNKLALQLRGDKHKHGSNVTDLFR